MSGASVGHSPSHCQGCGRLRSIAAGNRPLEDSRSRVYKPPRPHTFPFNTTVPGATHACICPGHRGRPVYKVLGRQATGAIQAALRNSAQRTGPSRNVWHYWGYYAGRGRTHEGCCRQLLGTELSEKIELAPQVGLELTAVRLTGNRVIGPLDHPYKKQPRVVPVAVPARAIRQSWSRRTC